MGEPEKKREEKMTVEFARFQLKGSLLCDVKYAAALLNNCYLLVLFSLFPMSFIQQLFTRCLLCGRRSGENKTD